MSFRSWNSSEDSFIVDNSPNEKPPCFVYVIRMSIFNSPISGTFDHSGQHFTT